jgi:hypothetical protein
VMLHRLKTWREFYPDVVYGIKPFEVRKDDRGYEAGDVLLLEEFDKDTQEYTGNESRYLVTYILRDPAFVKEGYCIMGIKPFVV